MFRCNGGMQTIGARIRQTREAQGLARKDLARAVGMSYTGLADLESGKAKSTTKLHRIASVLRVDATFLETGRHAVSQDVPASQSLRLDADTLSETVRALIERDEKRDWLAMMRDEPERFIQAYAMYITRTTDDLSPEQQRKLATKLADLTPQGAGDHERKPQVPAKGATRRGVGKG